MPRPAPSTSHKITPPRLHGVVPRQRLFETLANCGSPVAWISAAPGAGKSTLASSYCEASGANVLWYQVDAGDADAASWTGFMRQAAVRGGMATAVRLPQLPPEIGVDLAQFSRRWFRALYAALPPRTILVLDNVQDVSEAAFGAVLREAFEQLPEGITAIVASLSDPPLALARLVANRRIAILGPEQLRFTREESEQLARTRLTADAALLAELHERSAGWAAGLVLMIEHLSRVGSPRMPSLDASQAAVFDYFADQVFDGCAPAERRALMLSAALPRVTVRLAQVMGGPADVAQLLERLHQRHLFVDRRPGAETHYEYHRLFKAFLSARAQQLLPAAERAEAAQRAALLLEVDGALDDALTLYLAAQDGQAARRLLLQHAKRLQREGRWRSLLDWIHALPPGLQQNDPWLAYWSGACQVWTDAAQARVALEAAYGQFSASGQTAGCILAAGAISRACMLGADWHTLDPWIAALDALLSGDTSSVASDVLLAGCARLLYVMFARQPQHPRLAHWADRTSTLLATPVEPSEALFAGYSLLFYFSWTGQTAQAEQVIRQMAPLAHDARLSPASLAHWWWALANHQLHVGNPGESLASIEHALELAVGNGLTIAGVIRKHRIVHLLTLGRLADAKLELDPLATAPQMEPYFELHAWLALRLGDAPRALDEAQAALRQARARGRTFYAVLDELLLAIIHTALGAIDEARAQLKRFREATRGTPGERVAFQAALVDAAIALASGQAQACHAPLRLALEIGSRQRLRSAWGWDAAWVTPLLEEALQQGIGVAHARELIRSHRLRPSRPLARDIDNWPWPVRVLTLGRFEVQLDDHALRFEGKAQRKPLELLKVLIAAGEHAVAIEQLVESLWPNPEEGGRKAFDITVHRLRKLLACEGAVEVADRHARLDTGLVWVDAWALDRLLSAHGEATLAHLEAAAPRVMALCGGAFLAGDAESAWLLAVRHRVSNRFQRFAEQLGEQWERAGAWQRATALYQRVIELDPLAETFYRRQMLCLQAQGRRAEALEVFCRCRHLLSITLGVAPGRETEGLHRQLLGE